MNKKHLTHFKGHTLINEPEAEIWWKEELEKKDGERCWNQTAKGPTSLDIVQTW